MPLEDFPKHSVKNQKRQVVEPTDFNYCLSIHIYISPPHNGAAAELLAEGQSVPVACSAAVGG